MCKRRFLDIDILGPTCQLSLGQERSGEQHRKNTESLTTSMLFVLKSFINSLLYVKSNECRSALRNLKHSNPYNSIGKHLDAIYYTLPELWILWKSRVSAIRTMCSSRHHSGSRTIRMISAGKMPAKRRKPKIVNAIAQRSNEFNGRPITLRASTEINMTLCTASCSSSG